MRAMQVEAGAPLISSPVPSAITTAQPTSRRPLFVALAAVAVPVYAADQLTKAWVSANLEPGQPRDLVGSVLRLNLTHNSGAAFSIATGATWLLTLIASAVVLFILFAARRLGSRGWAVALGLLLGGSLGNLTDRMLRAPGPGRGEVVDFLQLPNFPVFNIGDSAIVTAACLIGLLAFRGTRIDGSPEPHHAAKHHSAKESPKKEQPPEHSTGTARDA